MNDVHTTFSAIFDPRAYINANGLHNTEKIHVVWLSEDVWKFKMVVGKPEVH